MRGAQIQTNKKISINEIVEFKKPEYVYIPLICGADSDITVIPKIGDYVYKGSIVAHNKGRFKMFVHSTVSGKVSSIEYKTLPNGNEAKCLIIENDFKEILVEITAVNENIRAYTKEEFIEAVKEAGIVGMSGSAFPTYVKFDTDTKIKTLIVNAVECEPFITADYVLLKTKVRDILEGIDAILEINDIDNCIIAVKETNRKLLKLINQYIGTYLNIRVKNVPDVYPMGYERSLILYTLGITYDKLPLEQNVLVCNVSTIYAIYRTLKTGLPVMDRIITISGNNAKRPTNISVKIGTPIKDILEAFPLYDRQIVLVTGGPMMGHSLETTDSMVTKELNAILALPPLKREETNCIRCGKCIQNCPAGICPILIKESIYNKTKLITLTPEKCIKCGLCSYTCPARIDLRNIVNDATLFAKEGDDD